jgi:pyruvate,water dikinase
VSICGEAPANCPEIAKLKFLAELGIASISVNPSSVLRTIQIVQEAEHGGTEAMRTAG